VSKRKPRKNLLFPKTGFGPLDALLRGVGVFVQQTQFGQLKAWQCSKCGAMYETNMGFTPRFCSMGCGETMRPLKADKRTRPVGTGSVRDRIGAAKFIALHAREPHTDRVLKDPEYRKMAYRRAAAKLHPDKGGSHDDFLKLQKAMEVLEG
jgi:hypothetical protein